MSGNPFSRLRQLFPPAPVWIGKVLEHHDDDTSTLELPTNQGVIPYGSTVAAGSTIRARGRTVPVGQYAFVRDGVIENQAPSGTPAEVVIGRVITAPSPLTFNGPIPDQQPEMDVAYSLNLNAFWAGGQSPRSWAVQVGALPAGLGLNTTSGVVSGTITVETAVENVSVQCTDARGNTATGTVKFLAVEEAGPGASALYAVADNAVVRSLNGGASWTVMATPPAGGNWKRLVRTSAGWVLTSAQHAAAQVGVAFSTDLTSWSLGTPSSALLGSEYDSEGASYFAVSSNAAGRVVVANAAPASFTQTAYSTDGGATWTKAFAWWDDEFLFPERYLYGMIWSQRLGLFIAASDLGHVLTSPDGQTWTHRYTSPEGASASFFSFVDTGTYIVAVNASEFVVGIARSTNGVTWTTGPNSINATVAGPGTSGLLYMMRYNTPGSGLVSTDHGATWSAGVTGLTGGAGTRALTWGGDAFYMLRYGTPFTVWRSTDGVNWAQSGTLPSGVFTFLTSSAT